MVSLRLSEPRQSWRTETQHIANSGSWSGKRTLELGGPALPYGSPLTLSSLPPAPLSQCFSSFPSSPSSIAPLPHRHFPATTRGRSGTTGTQEYPLGYLVSLGWGRHSGEDLPASLLFWPALSLGLALDYLLGVPLRSAGLRGAMVCQGRGSEVVASLGTRQNQLSPQPSHFLEL